MTEQDELDELLTELQNVATDITLELSKKSDSDETEILVMEESIENLADHVSSQAYQLRTARRVLKEDSVDLKESNGDTK